MPMVTVLLLGGSACAGQFMKSKKQKRQSTFVLSPSRRADISAAGMAVATDRSNPSEKQLQKSSWPSRGRIGNPPASSLSVDQACSRKDLLRDWALTSIVGASFLASGFIHLLKSVTPAGGDQPFRF